MTEFWMVWNEAGSQPRAKHDTYLSASQEAERLAKRNPGVRFVVLKAIAVCETTKPVTWEMTEPRVLSDDEIPF